MPATPVTSSLALFPRRASARAGTAVAAVGGFPGRGFAIIPSSTVTLPILAALYDRETGMAEIKIVNPDALGKPLGQYSHLTRVRASEFVFIAGQVGVDKDGKVVSGDFDAQCVQTFANIEAALKSVGAGWGNIVQFTTYLVHSQDIAKFMTYRLREFPKMFADGAYPPNTLLMIDRLVQEPLLVEVQAVAAL
jgi:enamine deaminase RidA (YjgF/YER057c/UK114 family)